MKNFRIKFVSLALLFSLLAVGASAQAKPQGGQQRGGQQPREQKSPEKIAEIKTDKMDQELDLTDAQEKKIYAINLKAAKEAAAKKEAAQKEREAKMKEAASQPKPQQPQQPQARPQGQKQRPSNEDMQAKLKERQEAKDAFHKSIMTILNDDQKMKYAMMVARAEVKQQMRKGPQGQGRQGGQQNCQQGRGQQQGKPQQPQQQGARPQRPRPVAETTETAAATTVAAE